MVVVGGAVVVVDAATCPVRCPDEVAVVLRCDGPLVAHEVVSSATTPVATSASRGRVRDVEPSSPGPEPRDVEPKDPDALSKTAAMGVTLRSARRRFAPGVRGYGGTNPLVTGTFWHSAASLRDVAGFPPAPEARALALDILHTTARRKGAEHAVPSDRGRH